MLNCFSCMAAFFSVLSTQKAQKTLCCNLSPPHTSPHTQIHTNSPGRSHPPHTRVAAQPPPQAQTLGQCSMCLGLSGAALGLGGARLWLVLFLDVSVRSCPRFW